MKWWRLLLSIFLFNSLPFFIVVQVFTLHFPLMSVICAASVKFLPVADWIHCRRGWNFRVIDLSIWKSYLEFPFEFATSSYMHVPSSCCCLSTLSFLCISAFSSWYRFLSLPFASLFFPDCCESLVRYPFLFLLWLDGSSRFSGHFQQNCLGTFPEIFWGYLILCSPSAVNLFVTSAANCFLFLEFIKIQRRNAVLSLFVPGMKFHFV